MFSIRIEDKGIVRWYKAEDYNSAIVLFDILTNQFSFVQLYGSAIEPLCDYNSVWAEEFAELAEDYQQNNPLCG